MFREERPFYLSPESVKAYKREDLVAYIRAFITPSNSFGKNALKVADKIVEFYTHGEDAEMRSEHFYFERYTQV